MSFLLRTLALCNSAIALFILGFVMSQSAHAHPMAPTLFKVSQVNEYTVNVLWKESLKKPFGYQLQPVFSKDCIKTSVVSTKQNESSLVYSWQVKCQIPIKQIIFSIEGFGAASNYAVFEFESENLTTSTILNSDTASFNLQSLPTSLASFQLFLEKGFKHFITGYDHLLFVLGLVVLLREYRKKLIAAISFFTLGHAISLIAATKYSWLVPEYIIEPLIVASLIWLALELLGDISKKSPVSIKAHPFVLTLLFGIVHGGGFANALLAHVKTENMWANVLGFNIGLELAQIMAVVVLLPLLFVIKERQVLLQRSQVSMAYLMGGASVYWLVKIAV